MAERRGRGVPLMALALALAGAARAERPLERGIRLYYQARYDSSLGDFLEALNAPAAGHRDSLVALQFLGMGYTQQREDSLGVTCFYRLLGLDSLWQFPENEDPAVLRNFTLARRMREREREQNLAEAARLAPAPARPAEPRPASPPRLSFAYGLVPGGMGWMATRHPAAGATLAALQAGGLLLSLYASSRVSDMRDPQYGVTPAAASDGRRWQAVQRISLSVALGAYLYSAFASLGGE